MQRVTKSCFWLGLITAVCAGTRVEAGPVQWQAAITTSAPTLWYQFEDTAGTTTPDSAGSNTGTYYSGGTSGSLAGTTRGVAALVGNGVTFSGADTTGGYVQATTVPLGQDFTVEVIAKSETSPSWDAYGGLGSTASGNAGFILHTNGSANSTSAYLYMQDTGTMTPTLVNPALDISSTVAVFHHYVLTYKESTHALTFYVDGTPTSTTVSATYSNLGSAGLTVEVGHQVGQGFADIRMPNITFDEWVLYNKTLTTGDVQAHFASITAVPEPTSFSLLALSIPALALRRRRAGK